jgi:hypothetical protein
MRCGAGLLASNPALGVKLPKRPPRRNVYLTAEQLGALADESGPLPRRAGISAHRRGTIPGYRAR